jgi:hypothetical protein
LAVTIILVNYRRSFSDAVDETLSLLGHVCKKAIYGYLESNYGIRREDIPMRLTDVSRIMKEIFGGPSADVLLTNIVQRFTNKLGVEMPKPTGAEEAVEIVRWILKGELGLTHDAVLTIPH